MSRVETPENETELRVFHNRLRILTSIDKHEMVDAGVIDGDEPLQWTNFWHDPYKWFICCPDDQASKLFGIIQKREKRT